MSNEFDRYPRAFASRRFLKFVAGVRVRAWHAIPLILGKAEDDARAAAGRGHTINMGWRGSLAPGA